MTELNSLAILTVVKQTGLQIIKDLTGSLLIKALTDLVLINTGMGSFTNTNFTTVKSIVNWRKNRFITAHSMYRFKNSFSTNRFTRRTNIVTIMCFTKIPITITQVGPVFTFVIMN